MVLKITLRPYSPSLNFLTLSSRPFPASLFFSAARITTATAANYGPSLKKGHALPLHKEQEQNASHNLLNEEHFTRVFDIAALRVPSAHCFALESRLRGHLLNWPRIRNIARAPGDEIDEELKQLFTDSSCSDELLSLNRRIYGKAEGDGEKLSPVLYRDGLARSFNSRGYAKFRNLAKISRPKRGREKKKHEDEGNGEGKRGLGFSGVAVVEVVEADDGGDLSGLLGLEFKSMKRWTGSTRLLLLDENHVDKRIQNMPEAIKVYSSLIYTLFDA